MLRLAHVLDMVSSRAHDGSFERQRTNRPRQKPSSAHLVLLGRLLLPCAKALEASFLYSAGMCHIKAVQVDGMYRCI